MVGDAGAPVVPGAAGAADTPIVDSGNGEVIAEVDPRSGGSVAMTKTLLGKIVQ